MTKYAEYKVYCTQYLAFLEPEPCSEPCQTAKMERFGRIIIPSN